MEEGGDKVRENKRSQASGPRLVRESGRREERKFREGRAEDKMVGEKTGGKKAPHTSSLYPGI